MHLLGQLRLDFSHLTNQTLVHIRVWPMRLEFP